LAEQTPTPAGRPPNRDSYTLSEVAEILHVPLRRVLEWLASGEIEAEQDPHSGRWRVPKRSLMGSTPARQSEEELSWRYEKERILLKLHEERSRADRERERADRLQSQLDGLRREMEVERMRSARWRLFGGKEKPRTDHH
jgi:excisionase family DNA binding protein